MAYRISSKTRAKNPKGKNIRRVIFVLFMFLSASSLCFAQQRTLLIDDFAGPINGGPNGTLSYGAGGGSTVEVTADSSLRYASEHSLKVVYNAVAGGYIWIARGFGLDARNAQWLVRPEDIDWNKYRAFSFYMYGSASNAMIAFDIRDSGGELYRFITKDTFQGWTHVVCPSSEFNVRQDYQPDTAVKNGQMDFPIVSFQFEPMESAGTLYFDKVELIERE